jgi:hypothetical protein
VVDERTDFTREDSDNVIVTAIRRRGEKMNSVVNVDDHNDMQSGRVSSFYAELAER